jgi:hypothetical protein
VTSRSEEPLSDSVVGTEERKERRRKNCIGSLPGQPALRDSYGQLGLPPSVLPMTTSSMAIEF